MFLGQSGKTDLISWVAATEKIHADDPKNEDVRLRLAADYNSVGTALVQLGDKRAAIELYERALNMVEAEVKSRLPNEQVLYSSADFYTGLGDADLKIAGKETQSAHQLAHQHRFKRVTDQEVEYLAKDTPNDKRVRRRYSNDEFVAILKEQVPDRGRHGMRYFGLLSPRSKACAWAAVFVLLRQKQRPHPRRLRWRWLHRKTFGIDPLLDSFGQVMHWIGRRSPVASR